MTIPLWTHQAEAVERCKTRNYFALFFEMGTGKTATQIHILRDVYEREGGVQRTLIVTPSSTLGGWLEQWQMHAPAEISSAVVAINSATVSKRLLQIREAKQCGKKIFIVNTEMLQSPKWPEILTCMGGPPIALVIDESARFKTHNAIRTKKVLWLAPRCKYRYIMTGSPVLNSPMDLWSQICILDQRLLPNWWKFRTEYFTDRNEKWKGKHAYFPDWQPKPDTLIRLGTLLPEFSSRVLKQDCLDLPPLLKIVVPVEMTADQREHYDAMADDWVVELGNGETVMAELAMTKSLRLQQICNGLLKPTENETPYKVECAKLDMLDELITDIGAQKFIVWSCWNDTHADIAALLDKRKIGYRFITGAQTAIEKREAEVAFRDDATVTAIIANQAAGGTGMNLQAASVMIYYAKNHNLGNDLQSEARNYRGGSEMHDKVTRYDLEIRDSIETDIGYALKNKASMAELVLAMRQRLEQTGRNKFQTARIA